MSGSSVDLYIGRALRFRRRQLGMTQADVAGKIGVRFQQIQKYECAQNHVSAARLFDLAQAVQWPVASFFPVPQAAANNG